MGVMEARVRRILERFGEDERLRGDLDDTAAQALIDWACRRTAALAADPDRSDQAVELLARAVRRAARQAARSGAPSITELLEAAERALARSGSAADRPAK